MIERRLKEPTTDIDYNELLGSKVKVAKLSMSINEEWNNPSNTIFTIGKISFRISIDGKCHTIIELKEKPGLLFTLGDIILCQEQ